MSFLDTTQLALEAAMSGSMMRQSLLTNDLANAETPNFKPEDVNFQQTLEQAVSSGQPLDQVTFNPTSDTNATGPDGNGVNADATNAQIAENGLLYQDLTKIAAAREGIFQTALNTNG